MNEDIKEIKGVKGENKFNDTAKNIIGVTKLDSN
jgi:hypothetical protein